MIALWRWELFPGETFSATGHLPGTAELFHVEAGILHVDVGTTELVIAKGCSAVAKTEAPHDYSDKGKAKLVFTMSMAEIHRFSNEV